MILQPLILSRRFSPLRNDGSLPLYMSIEYLRMSLVTGSRSYIKYGGNTLLQKPPESEKFRTSRLGNWRSPGKQKPASEKRNSIVSICCDHCPTKRRSRNSFRCRGPINPMSFVFPFTDRGDWRRPGLRRPMHVSKLTAVRSLIKSKSVFSIRIDKKYLELWWSSHSCDLRQILF
jgi:hypothetical protein